MMVDHRTTSLIGRIRDFGRAIACSEIVFVR